MLMHKMVCFIQDKVVLVQDPIDMEVGASEVPAWKEDGDLENNQSELTPWNI
jgi:hypothetical protein